MNFRWNNPRTNTSALEDLLRALEYAEARATITVEPRGATSRSAAGADPRPPLEREASSIDEDGPPYGRGV